MALQGTPLEFKRTPHRLAREEYFGQKWYFVTFCCERRTPVFVNEDRAHWIVEFMKAESARHEFVVDAYCVMPDHLHLLVLGMRPTSNLLAFAKSLKQKSAYTYQQEVGIRLWQKNFYDHVLRSSEETSPAAAYIWMNPVRKGLCKRLEDYPFSGSFSRPWKIAPAGSVWTPPWKKPKMPA